MKTINIVTWAIIATMTAHGADLSVQPPLLDKEMFEILVQHARKYSTLFTQKGINKVSTFLGDLDRLVHNQLLLRAENQHLADDLGQLSSDYRVIMEVVDENTANHRKNECIYEILGTYSKQEFALHDNKDSRYEGQQNALKVIIREAAKFHETISERLEEIELKSSGAIEAMAASIVRFADFFEKYTELIMLLRDERTQFANALFECSGREQEKLVLSTALLKYPTVIERLQQVSRKAKEREAPRREGQGIETGKKKKQALMVAGVVKTIVARTTY